MSIYITGDVHGDFLELQQWCSVMKPRGNDIIVILGDVALNYFGDDKDYQRKKLVNTFGPEIFCIHGNHEMRPEDAGGYTLIDWHGSKAWQQPEFPNLIFAKDGEIYELAGKKVIVLGGAYSVDKNLRLLRGYKWFPNEQPSDEIKRFAERQLTDAGWKVDAVFSHTCPYKYRPLEAMLHGLDQSKVDTSTEEWLDQLESRLDYQKWYCGHWHINKRIDKMEFLFHDVRLF